MPFKKIPYNWQRVKAGDIITFSYQSSRSSQKKNNSILVLNPKIPVTRKDGSTTFHLTGIKIKENGKIRVRFMSTVVKIFERVGKIIPVQYDDDVFGLEIEKTFLISEIKGIKENGFNKITTMKLIRNNYRTYDWLKARKSPVFLDWIKISDKEDYLPEPIKEEIKKAKKEEKKMKERDPETQKNPVKKGKK